MLETIKIPLRGSQETRDAEQKKVRLAKRKFRERTHTFEIRWRGWSCRRLVVPVRVESRPPPIRRRSVSN